MMEAFCRDIVCELLERLITFLICKIGISLGMLDKVARRRCKLLLDV